MCSCMKTARQGLLSPFRGCAARRLQLRAGALGGAEAGSRLGRCNKMFCACSIYWVKNGRMGGWADGWMGGAIMMG
jgi:hypothetical protein